MKNKQFTINQIIAAIGCILIILGLFLPVADYRGDAQNVLTALEGMGKAAFIIMMIACAVIMVCQLTGHRLLSIIGIILSLPLPVLLIIFFASSSMYSYNIGIGFYSMVAGIIAAVTAAFMPIKYISKFGEKQSKKKQLNVMHQVKKWLKEFRIIGICLIVISIFIILGLCLSGLHIGVKGITIRNEELEANRILDSFKLEDADETDSYYYALEGKGLPGVHIYCISKDENGSNREFKISGGNYDYNVPQTAQIVTAVNNAVYLVVDNKLYYIEDDSDKPLEMLADMNEGLGSNGIFMGNKCSYASDGKYLYGVCSGPCIYKKILNSNAQPEMIYSNDEYVSVEEMHFYKGYIYMLLNESNKYNDFNYYKLVRYSPDLEELEEISDNVLAYTVGDSSISYIDTDYNYIVKNTDGKNTLETDALKEYIYMKPINRLTHVGNKMAVSAGGDISFNEYGDIYYFNKDLSDIEEYKGEMNFSSYILDDEMISSNMFHIINIGDLNGVIKKRYDIRGNMPVLTDYKETENNTPLVGENEITEPTKAPTTVPATETPKRTETGYPQLSGYSDTAGYGIYTSLINGFHSKYPADFNITLCTDKMLSGVGADNGDIDITWDYSDGKSIDQKYQEFIDSCLGTIEYKSVGNNYYAVRVLYRSIYTYMFRKIENGIEYGFSMSFPYDKFDKYDAMINVIYQSMKDQ